MSRKIFANLVMPISSAPIPNGYVEVDEEGTILSIGQMTKETESTEYYNGILCPGFVNTHCHSELSYLKDKFKEGTGMAGFIDQINSLRDSTDKDARLLSIQTAMDTMYNAGVSGLGDISNGDESFEIKVKSPIYTRTFLEVFGSEPEDADDVMKSVRKLEAKAKSMNLDAAPTPHSPYTTSPILIEKVSADALKEGYLSYHNQESKEEDDLLISDTGHLAENYHRRKMSVPAGYGKAGIYFFMDKLLNIHKAPFNEHILLVHNTVTDEQAMDYVTSMCKNLYWVTCPLSNLFIHKMLAPLNLWKKKGLNISIGTDSLSSNHVLSMIEELKCIQKHFPEISLEDTLKWATLNGAKALGKEDILGSFEIGKKAGLVLINNIDWHNIRLTNKSESKRLI
ncbi:MAG: amidohydrolase family protein [Bacteroidales bacterium]